MDGGLALLGAADMQGSRAAELDLRPLQFAGLPGAQAVAVGHDDQAGIPQAPAAVLGRLDQLLDLGRGQIFARAQIGISRPRRHNRRIDGGLGCGNLPVFVTWLDQLQARNRFVSESMALDG